MSSQDLDTLALLLERASADRDRLSGEMRRAEEVQRHQQAQADHLAAYREEYVQRWSRQFGRGGAIEIVQCYQSFMQRLEEAMLQQAAQVERASAMLHQLRDALQQAEMRVASVRKLIERRLQERARVEQRQEQKESDEAAQHLAHRRGTHGLAFHH
jgi:flagellar protein FliJ